MIILKSEAVLNLGSNMCTMKDINQQGHGRLKNSNYLPVSLRKASEVT